MSAEDVYAYIRERGVLYGAAAAIEESVEHFLDAGCGGFMVVCNSAPAVHGSERLAARPSVRRALGTTLPRGDG